MGSFWHTVAAIVLGGGITLVGSYLAHRWQAGRESERYQRERRDRLNDERRNRREGVANDVWCLAARCYRLYKEWERGSVSEGERGEAVVGAVGDYASGVEANRLLLATQPEVERSVRVFVLTLTWVPGLESFGPDLPEIPPERIVKAIRKLLKEGGLHRMFAGRKKAVEAAYTDLREALSKFAGITESEDALDEAE